MEQTQLKREHFEKGREFDPKTFDAYIEESQRVGKTVYLKYLGCVAGGIAVSFLFSKGVGGFYGNILAVVCVLGGMLVGAGVMKKCMEGVNHYASVLGITPQDVKAAQKNRKNGTFAWTDEKQE